MSHVGAIWEPFWVHFGTPEPFWVHFGAHLGLQEHIWAADPILGPILEPFWDHFGVQFGPKKQPKNKRQFKTLSDTILGPILDAIWVHSGALGAPRGSSWRQVGSILGSILGSRSASGQLTPFWDQCWSHLGSILGLLFGPKQSLNTRAVLIPCLTPFWDPFWSHFGTKFGPIWVSIGVCAENPGAASPRHGFRCFSGTSDMAKPLKNHWFLMVLAIAAEAVLATQISPK